jgi:hypothetical protein
MDIEDQGKPVVALVNKGFVKDARSAVSSRGMPTLRILPENIRCESTVQADIEKGVAEVMDGIVAGLTKPLTPEEKAPKYQAEVHPRIAFKGSYQEVNHRFYSSGWTDGMPIVPPTEAAVAEMLTGTDLPRGHVVGRIIPRLGKATVEKIAINAVMAGALPTHMPVLLAAVELLCDYGTRFDIFEVSTGSWAPFVLINGPVRHDINLNTSSGLFSPGDMANSTIGRAVGLIVRNIGGARKGIEDMGTLGNPAKYSLVLGESEEESPWEPWHVERGFKKEDSTVTMFFPNQYIQSTARLGTDAKGILDSIAGYSPRIMSSLVIIPSHAEILASEGWTKAKVREYVMKLGEAPSAESRPQRGGATAPAAGAKPATPKDASMETVRGIGLTKQADAMPTTPRDALMIVVAGGPGAWFGLHRSAGGGIIGNDFISKKIQLPKNWTKVVAKYKDLVPDYELY